uniref:Uncharacterized protein n=1 Tax=viral metagenome TaxID=1070528 RepID=A0A6M3LKF0_9ZZZZ
MNSETKVVAWNKFKENDIVTWGDGWDFGAVAYYDERKDKRKAVWVMNVDVFWEEALTLVCKAENREDRK